LEEAIVFPIEKKHLFEARGIKPPKGVLGYDAKIVRDAFAFAREKVSTIIFIDEIDSVGLKRGGDAHGNKEVQRTMLELLNQLDGFSSTDDVKVISFTNSADILEPNPDNYEVY